MKRFLKAKQSKLFGDKAQDEYKEGGKLQFIKFDLNVQK